MHEIEWLGLGVAATLAAAGIAHWVGLFQITLMRRAHDLNVRLAMPKVGTHPRIVPKNVLGTNHAPFYYLVISIYNEGDLPAKDLNGRWTIYSPINEIKRREGLISREFLRACEYELEACQIEGTTLHNAMMGGQGISINIDIEFDYFGISENEPQHYARKYEFDPENPMTPKKI
jgi:hypothetical protein